MKMIKKNVQRHIQLRTIRKRRQRADDCRKKVRGREGVKVKKKSAIQN
jgi:hypothetical protein